MIGTTISHYKILEKLGEGGMGVVYKAQDTKLDRLVALKFLPHHLTAEETERARFLQEAKAAATLNHPNICTIYGIEEEAGQQFIEMEFVDGVTLRHKIPIDKSESVLGYVIQIGEALEEAHAKGVVHRDIKPENIMVNTKNQIKVMDFGLAKLKNSLKLTRTSSTVGTLAYMAPEQIQGEEVDARSDIFSFGIVLYEMWAGKLPFRGEHEAAIMYSIVNEEPDSVQTYRPETPPELLHILGRALEKDPADRYQTVSDMVIDLRRLKKQSTKVTRSGSFKTTVSQKADTSEKPTPALTQTRRRTLPMLVGSAAIFVVILLVWKLWVSDRYSSSTRYPFQTFQPLRISTDAPANLASISPDGKYVIYSVNESGRQSVWMRQVSAMSSVRILAPDSIQYGGFCFSPDGNYVYYTAISRNESRGALYVVPALGGTSHRILSNIQGVPGISPDGKEISFLRAYEDEGEEALMNADVDGSHERKLVSRRGEEYFLGAFGEGPTWSPDGKTIAVASGSTIGKIHMNVLFVNVADGSFRFATAKRWDFLGRTTWVNNGRGVVFLAAQYLSGASGQLWYLDAGDGSSHQITSDLAEYNNGSLDITADQSTLLSVQAVFNGDIEVLPGGDWQKSRRITSRNGYQEGLAGIDWSADGRIVFTSLANGNNDIWSMDGEGKSRRQLTSTSFSETNPSVSWDGRFITYSSRGDTTPHAWIMNIDGTDPKQLTFGPDDYLPYFAPGDKWIYLDSYRDKGRRNAWKVPVGGGDLVKVSDEYLETHGVSPDGRFLAVRLIARAGNNWVQAIIDAATGKVVKTFTLPLTASQEMIGWMPDGKSICYVDFRDNVSNIWVLPLETLKPYQLTRFESSLIVNFAWSKHGKDLAIVRGDQTRDIVLLKDTK